MAFVGHEPPHPPSRPAERLPPPDRRQGARHLRAERRRELTRMACARRRGAAVVPDGLGPGRARVRRRRHAEQRRLPVRRRRPGVLPPRHPAPPRARLVPARPGHHRRPGPAQRLPARSRRRSSARRGVPQPALFLGIYLVVAGAALPGRRARWPQRLGLSPWAQVAVMAALTLKHRVGHDRREHARRATAHPRHAGVRHRPGGRRVRCCARGRGAAHRRWWRPPSSCTRRRPCGSASGWASRSSRLSRACRPWLIAAGGLAAVVAAWVIGWGPLSAQLGPHGRRLAGRAGGQGLPVRHASGRRTCGRWPSLYAARAGRRVRRAPASRRDAAARGARWSSGSPRWLAIFAATLPLVAARVALAVQFQVSRMFWMLDLTATVYAVWALADDGAPEARDGRPDPARGSRRAAS
ncbi:MAG: hypothetical protein M0C28_16410 [Candidatus Moduliflexus flocculans]|nr:hypothetical protein [Candidatus Moduliflexus flocculans]